MSLVVERVSVRRGRALACRDVSFRVDPGEIVAVLGPSGSGKTTLLRAIAGLEPVDSGRVTFAGADLASVPPERRGFGLMFQDLALFPHLDVAENVAYGLRMRGTDRGERERRTTALLARIGLGDKAGRTVDQLSGGERQRVALARALAAEPRLLLLDEPLGSLDRQLRVELGEVVVGELRARGAPAMVVTHDHDEAFALADRVIVLRDGSVVQDAPTLDVWRSPIDEWTSDFVGHPPAVDAEVRAGCLETPWGNVDIDHADGSVRLVVPRAATRVALDGEWSGRVAYVRPERDGIAVTVRAESGAELVTTADDPPSVGAAVRLRVRGGRLLLFGV